MTTGFQAIGLGKIVAEAENDPDETMQLALTRKEAGMVLFGLHFVHSLFPEMHDDVQAFCKKIAEVGLAQEFLNEEEDD